MRILIDTNVFIPLEPSSPEDVESGGDRATALARHASVEDVQLLVHPDSLVDIGRDQRTDRQRLRRALFEKYVSLEAPPEITPEMEAVVGPSKRGGNHWVDNRLLAAVSADAVSLLVTEDRGIHQKARRLGIHERVLTTDDATSLLESLTEQPARPLPLVSDVPTHVISTSDPILQSLRADYPGFDKWFSGIRQEARRAFVIRDSSQRCAALCIRKPDDDQYGLGGKPLKLSTFKVGESYAGNRFGELLLKAVFEWASNNAYNLIWLSVFEHHEVLVSMLDDFGFEPTGHRTDRGELVLAKRLLGDTTEQVPDPFEHHRLHGPPSLCLGQEADYLVPIQPQFHRMLFPELEGEVQEWCERSLRTDIHDH